MRPFDHAENQRDPEIDEDRAPRHWQDRRQGHQRRQMREALDHLDAALDQDVGPAAVIAGNAADQDAERKADDDADEPDRQRDARAVDNARQEIAAEPVGAEQKERSALGWADQVKITWDIAPKFVGIAVTEPADRLAF